MVVWGASRCTCHTQAPRSLYKKVYVLPLPSISMNKGTGVVTG